MSTSPTTLFKLRRPKASFLLFISVYIFTYVHYYMPILPTGSIVPNSCTIPMHAGLNPYGALCRDDQEASGLLAIACNPLRIEAGVSRFV
ncbi:hypothetical protein PM082_022439 [Marasmius tenuissimus]|nr:hypothetical protein PM082_022439 [Marasmius tenuissimus]